MVCVLNRNLESEQDYLNYINKEFNSNKYGVFKVISVHHINDKGVKYYVCRFIDSGFEFVQNGRYIRNGKVADKTKVHSHEEYFLMWSNMVKRVINPKLNDISIYKDCSIQEEWTDFLSFKKDIPNIIGYKQMEIFKIKGIKFNLDKDILFHGNKLYSVDTCCWVPADLNAFFTNKQNTNTTGFEGVSKKDGKYRARAKDGEKNKKVIEVGGFNTAQEAYDEYCKIKKNILTKLLIKFNWLDARIKEACIVKLESQREETIKNNKST